MSEHKRWKIAAFLTRYTATPLSEFWQMTTTDVNAYTTAVAELLTEENRPQSGGTRGG